MARCLGGWSLPLGAPPPRFNPWPWYVYIFIICPTLCGCSLPYCGSGIPARALKSNLAGPDSCFIFKKKKKKKNSRSTCYFVSFASLSSENYRL